MLRRLGNICGSIMLALAVSAGGAVTPAQASAPLSIDWAYCESSWGTDPWRYFFCEASASGGTGSYTYSWSGIRYAGFHQPNGSIANGTCTVNQTARVQVSVTDSAGATVVQQVWFACPYDPF